MDNCAVFMGILATVSCLMVQTFFLMALAPQRYIGDEKEYYSGPFARRGDGIWVRVPLFQILLWPSRWGWINPRFLVSVFCSLICGLATWYASFLAGPMIAAATLAILCLSMEGRLLSVHLWPDSLLGGMLLAFVAVTAHANTAVDWGLAGTVAAIALLVRIDFTVLVLVGLGLIIGEWALDWAHVAAFLAAPLFAIALWTLHNGLKWGIWLPDTTVLFNLRVAKVELQADAGTRTADLMAKTEQQTRLPPSQRSKVRFSLILVKGPFTLIRRLQCLLGAETFCSQKLIWKNQAQYKGGSGLLRNWFFLQTLKWHFTVVILTTLMFLTTIESRILVILGSMILTFVLIQTRSRYRAALLPTLAVFCPIQVLDALSRTESVSVNWAWSGLFVVGALVVIAFPGAKTEE